jgi:hypothetical protein
MENKNTFVHADFWCDTRGKTSFCFSKIFLTISKMEITTRNLFYLQNCKVIASSLCVNIMALQTQAVVTAISIISFVWITNKKNNYE